MFGRLMQQWRDLTTAKPGRRFQNRYYARKKRRSNPLVKLVYLVLGAVLTIAGIVLLPAPGPGFLVIFVGAAMLAEESLLIAHACDWAEVKARAVLKRARRAWKRVSSSPPRRSNRGG
jgi:uncharacterized protein (TIGR02611 family)